MSNEDALVKARIMAALELVQSLQRQAEVDPKELAYLENILWDARDMVVAFSGGMTADYFQRRDAVTMAEVRRLVEKYK